MNKNAYYYIKGDELFELMYGYLKNIESYDYEEISNYMTKYKTGIVYDLAEKIINDKYVMVDKDDLK